MIISLSQRFLQIVENIIIRLSVKVKEALLQDVFVLCLLFVYNRKLIIKTRCMSYLFVFKRSLLGVKICLSYAQIGLL